jgi:hypothetical protein
MVLAAVIRREVFEAIKFEDNLYGKVEDFILMKTSVRQRTLTVGFALPFRPIGRLRVSLNP